MLQLRNILSPQNLSPSKTSLTLKDATKWNFGYGSNDSGISINEKRSIMHTGVYRAVNLLAGAIATSPKHLIRRGDGDRQREIARDHSAHQLIYRRPNRVQNRFQFHTMAVIHFLIWGNFYGYINRNRFYEPVSIVPIMPWNITPETKGGRKQFRTHHTPKKEAKDLTDNEILHIYGFTFDGIKGVSPIKYMRESIALGLAAQKLEATSFGKGMHAGGTLELPEEYAGMMGSTDEEAEEHMGQIRQSIRETYQSGPDSWHEMLLLEPGWKYTQFEMAYEVDKLIANKKFSMGDVSRIFGVPIHKLMELDRATDNNIEHQGIEYVQDGVMPMAVNFSDCYDDKLLKESEKDEYYFNINLNGLMRADMKTRFEAYSTMLGKNAPGWGEPAEVRELEDMDAGNPENWAIPQNMDRQKDRDNSNRDAA